MIDCIYFPLDFASRYRQVRDEQLQYRRSSFDLLKCLKRAH